MKSFNVTKAERSLIVDIVARGLRLARKAGATGLGDATDLEMDITACHVNGNPLRLEPLLEADDFNFAHDFFGINRHIDRKTGKLTDFFRPRYSA